MKEGDRLRARPSAVFWLRFLAALIGAGSVVAAIILVAPKLLPRLDVKKFRSERFEFELPGGWACESEGSEWVCNLASATGHREAIIILAEKIRGPQDTLDVYEAHLREPRRLQATDGGEDIVSEVRFVRRSRYRGHDWVDALHFQSEVRGYLTRYLASTTSGSAILVTFSAAAQSYQKYVKDLDRLLESLRVYQARD